MASDSESSLLTGLLSHTTRNTARVRRVRSFPNDADLDPGRYNNFTNEATQLFLHSRINLPTFRRMAIYLIFYLAIGTIWFYLVRDHIKGEKTNGILDSVYLCVVTVTTVGYGDLVPNSAPTKLLACVVVLLGMTLVGLILSKGAAYLVEKQEIWLIQALHMRVEFGPAEILKEMETNKVKYKCLMMLSFLVVLFVFGTVFLATVEKMDAIDAFYCVFSTITTLGYGDKSFSTKAGRVFAIFWILISTICLVVLLCCLAELSAERRQKALVKYVLMWRMKNAGLEPADYV